MVLPGIDLHIRVCLLEARAHDDAPTVDENPDSWFDRMPKGLRSWTGSITQDALLEF